MVTGRTLIRLSDLTALAVPTMPALAAPAERLDASRGLGLRQALGELKNLRGVLTLEYAELALPAARYGAAREARRECG